MIIFLELTFRDGYCSLHCDDLPGLNIFGDAPEKTLADFIPMWRRLHEISPASVMPIPICKPFPKSVVKQKSRGKTK